jgi:hypothetical protein
MTDRLSISPGTRPSALAWLPAVAAAALSLALYAVTLRGTYIFDDCAIILEDPRIANPQLWHEYWTDQYFPDAPDNLYRPLTSMSYALQWRLHGDRAWAFHLVNWLLAAAAAAAVAEFARRSVVMALSGVNGGVKPGDASRRGVWAGLVAGLLFAAHPVHVEVVAGIVGRAELLCTLATFAGLCLFLRRPMTGGRAVAIVVCFFIALLSKEQGALYPLLLAILAFVRVPRAALSPRERACNRWLAVGLIWFESAYFFFREHILKFEWNRQWISFAANPLIRSAGADRWLMPLVLMGRYVAVLVAPYKLSLDYGGGVIGPSVRYHEPYFYLGIAAVIGWLVAFVALIKVGACRPGRTGGPPLTIRSTLAGLALFALLGVALTFGMVSNLLALIGTIFGERLAFMPSAFLAVLAGLVVAGIAAGARRWVLACVLALVAMGSVGTVTYARQWNDAAALYKTEVAQQPKSVFLHALVYREYMRAGNWPAARAIGEACRKQVPEWWQSWLMCFEPDIEMGRLKEAHDLIHQAAHVCYNDALIGWSHRVEEKLAEQAKTQPTTQPSQPGQ